QLAGSCRFALNVKLMKLIICLAVVLSAFCSSSTRAQRPKTTRRATSPAASSAARTLTVLTEPNATVWLDEIRRGNTDSTGRLAGLKVSAGAHTLRIRASGFKESSTAVPAAQRGEIRVRLVRTTDEAELTFQ